MKQRTKRVQALSKLRLYRMNLLSALLNPVSESLEDRTAALIIATNLEHALEDAIASFFQGNIEKLRQRSRIPSFFLTSGIGAIRPRRIVTSAHVGMEHRSGQVGAVARSAQGGSWVH